MVGDHSQKADSVHMDAAFQVISLVWEVRRKHSSLSVFVWTRSSWHLHAICIPHYCDYLWQISNVFSVANLLLSISNMSCDSESRGRLTTNGLHRIHTSGGLSQPKTGLNPWGRFINYKFINQRKELVYFINDQHSTESSAIRGLKNKDT